MDDLIMAVYRAFSVGATIDQVHQAIIDKGWSSEDAFLAIKAGEYLYDCLQQQ